MPDHAILDAELDGLDPYDLFDAEAGRLDAYLSHLDAAGWDRPSRSAGWSTRDMLGHLRASEDYQRASLDGTVQALLTSLGERGATDLATVNAIGVADFADRDTDDLLDEWRTVNATHRREFRARGDGMVDTTVGDYPARWQAFHLAMELAIHADDVDVPVRDDERVARNAWRARVSRFMLSEAKPDVRVSAANGQTTVEQGDHAVTVDDDTFVEAVAARLDESSGISPDDRALLGATP